MKVLLVGSTGMLGQAILKMYWGKNIFPKTVSRTNADHNIDLVKNTEKIIDVIKSEKPDIVINTAAWINLEECEKNPGEAYILNGKLPGLISDTCNLIGSYFVQISTDHFYINDNLKQHLETDKVILLNEYARTKFIGESLALINKNTLVLRTNIVGFRSNNNLTFVEWIFNNLENDNQITGFTNYYTSSIDVYTFSAVLSQLIEKQITGIINIGSNDVISKYDFIFRIAQSINKEFLVSEGKMEDNNIKRGNSLGLNVMKVEAILNQKMPSSEKVIQNIVGKYKEGAMNEL